MDALTLSTADGLVVAEHTDDGVELTVAGSRAMLTADEAGTLADYLTERPDDAEPMKPEADVAVPEE